MTGREGSAGAAATAATAELWSAVDRLCRTVSHWTPARWAARGADGASRGDVVAGAVQRIADLAAAAEAQPSRAVPRLDNDLALCDQLRVVSGDLAAAAPATKVLVAATEIVDAARREL